MTVGQLKSLLMEFDDNQDIVIDDCELDDYVRLVDVGEEVEGRVVLYTEEPDYL